MCWGIPARVNVYNEQESNSDKIIEAHIRWWTKGYEGKGKGQKDQEKNSKILKENAYIQYKT